MGERWHDGVACKPKTADTGGCCPGGTLYTFEPIGLSFSPGPAVAVAGLPRKQRYGGVP